jgi:hypothetical protein
VSAFGSEAFSKTSAATMSGVVVKDCRAATASPAKSPANRPTAKTRVIMIYSSVAGKAERVTCVMRRIVNCGRMRKARRIDEANPKNERDGGGHESAGPFAATDDRYRINLSSQMSLLDHPSGAM